MFVSITDEIIDAIIQNERCHAGRSRKPQPSTPALRASRNLADLKPDWSQFLPGTVDAMTVVDRRSGTGFTYPRMQS
jgi:hypothetical protein